MDLREIVMFFLFFFGGEVVCDVREQVRVRSEEL